MALPLVCHFFNVERYESGTRSGAANPASSKSDKTSLTTLLLMAKVLKASKINSNLLSAWQAQTENQSRKTQEDEQRIVTEPLVLQKLKAGRQNCAVIDI